MSELEREDLELEAALRPKDLSEFVGQQRVVLALLAVIDAFVDFRTRAQKEPPEDEDE